MKRLIIQAAMLLLLPTFAAAKTCDIAPYAIQSPYWPCDAMMRALEPCHEIRIALLLHTFGDDNSCLARVLADRRTTAVEFHAINERCQERAGGCAPHEWMAGLPMSVFAAQLRARTPQIMQRVGIYATEQAGRLIPLLRPETICFISPVLETKLTPAEFLPLAEIFHWQMVQRCHVVFGPLKNIGHPGRFVYEIHGEAPRISPPCLKNLDGVGIALDLASSAEEKKRKKAVSRMITEAQARSYFRNSERCGAAFAWNPEDNGKGVGSPNNPILRRNFPTEEIFRRVVSLFP